MFFFFKQKTAYEMRISDWSSDVCSSDLDASHSSDATFDQLLALSKYPILLSHSSLRSAHDHPRNLDEGRLKKLAAKGGAMCISTIYMSDMNMSPARAKLFGEYEHKIGRASGRERVWQYV